MSNIEQIKKSLADIIDGFAEISNDVAPWKTLLKRAQGYLDNINKYEEIVKNDEKFNTMMKNSIEGRKYLNYQSIEKQVNEITHINLLKSAIIQGYAFVQEFSSFMRKESLEYLLLFNDADSQKIGSYTLEELLPTLNITYNTKQGFNLQINQLDELANLKTKETNVRQTFAERAIDAFNLLSKQRQEFLAQQKWEKMSEEERYKYESSGKKLYVHQIGGAGIIFEQAVNRLARAIVTGTNMDMAVDKFKADTKAFYLRGDVEEKEFINEILQDAKDLTLELKAVRTQVQSSYSMGARLTGSVTVQNALKRIIDVLSKDNQEEIAESLNKLFDAGSLTRIIDEEADAAAEKGIEKLLPKNIKP
jgi:hypothetical protein